jgi:hypothetical protein
VGRLRSQTTTGALRPGPSRRLHPLALVGTPGPAAGRNFVQEAGSAVGPLAYRDPRSKNARTPSNRLLQTTHVLL